MIPILNITIAWLATQCIKILLQRNIQAVVQTGGMPSAHASLVGALAMQSYLSTGIASLSSAICFVLLILVIHDAVHIRKHHTFPEVSIGALIGALIVFVLSYA